MYVLVYPKFLIHTYFVGQERIKKTSIYTVNNITIKIGHVLQKINKKQCSASTRCFFQRGAFCVIALINTHSA